MAKKLLCVITLMLALVSLLASCGGDNATHTHSYGAWETTKAATCKETGTEARYCDCGETQTRDVAKIEHEYGEWTVTKNATCKETGTEARYCYCGETQTRDVAKLTTHTWIDATYTEPKTCSVCGTTEGNPLTQPSENYEAKYSEALELLAEGNYSEAYQLLSEIKDYAKAQEKLKNFFYAPGKVLETMNYNDGSTRNWIIHYEYNKNGNLIKESTMLDGELRTSHEYTYDSLGNLLTGWNNYGDPVQYFYDSDGKIAKTIVKSSYQLYTYNEHGNVTEIKYYNSNDEHTGSDVYTYEYNNGIVFKIIIDDCAVYTYDENGNLVSYVYYSDDSISEENISTKAEFEYDEKKRLIKVTVSDCWTSESAGGLVCDTYMFEYTYNTTGQLQKVKITYDDLETRVYEYLDYELYYNTNASATEKLEEIYIYDLDVLLEEIF